jgi:hypothetical protein
VGEREAERALAAVLEEPDVRHYLTWSRFPYFRILAAAEGYHVQVADVRYDGRGSGSLAGLTVTVLP